MTGPRLALDQLLTILWIIGWALLVVALYRGLVP